MFWRLDLLWKQHSPEHFPKLHLELKWMETFLFSFQFSDWKVNKNLFSRSKLLSAFRAQTTLGESHESHSTSSGHVSPQNQM